MVVETRGLDRELLILHCSVAKWSSPLSTKWHITQHATGNRFLSGTPYL